MGDVGRFMDWVGARAGALAAAGLVWALASGVVVAQSAVAPPKTTLIEPPTPLLPQTLGKLERVAEGDSGDGLGQVDAADAAVLKEDGLKRFAKSDYATTEGVCHCTVAVYNFGDASGAEAAFDYFRRPGTAYLDKRLADQAASDGSRYGVVFRSGTSVVRESFNMYPESVDIMIHNLIAHLPKVAGPSAMPPPLPSFLPGKGLDADSVRYALGPVGYHAIGGVLLAEAVGFDKSAETVTARYKNGGTLTLIEYPTPQIAADRGRAIEAELKQPAVSLAAGTVKLRREGPLLMVTTGAWKPDAAQALIDGIHLRDVMSFDQPMPLEFHAEVQKTFSLLTSIAIFCGVGALAALVLGLFFGGGRALIRVMQGKPAATEPEFLRIDLRGPRGKSLRGPRGKSLRGPEA
jgi:hypothetical protein